MSEPIQDLVIIGGGVMGLMTACAAAPLSNNITIKGAGASNLTVQRDPNAVPFSVFRVQAIWYRCG